MTALQKKLIRAVDRAHFRTIVSEMERASKDAQLCDFYFDVESDWDPIGEPINGWVN